MAAPPQDQEEPAGCPSLPIGLKIFDWCINTESEWQHGEVKLDLLEARGASPESQKVQLLLLEEQEAREVGWPASSRMAGRSPGSTGHLC